MSRYGWTYQYLVNDPRSRNDFLPYSQWRDVVQSVCEAVANERRFAMQCASLTGYQNYLFLQPRKKGSQPMTVDRFFRSFGVAEARKGRGSKAEAIARANANFERWFGGKIRNGKRG